MQGLFRYVIAGAILFGAWKGASVWFVSAMLPPPEAVFAALGHAFKTGEFWIHFGVSAYRVTAAMATAWVVGFPLGLLLGGSRRADRYLSPFVFLTYPVPKIVLLPVFLVLFGLGDFSKVLMIALIIGFQIVVACRDSVIGLDRKYIDSFRSLGGSGRQILRHVIVPAALPQAFTALRIGTGTGIAVLFFVESFATSRGLGYLIMDSWGRFDTIRMFVGIVGMSLLGVLLYELFDYLEKTLCAWKYLEAGRARAAAPGESVADRLFAFGRMIKISHTVFALPFALSAVVLAHRAAPVTPGVFFWILAALFGARSAAMGFNRIVDARFDALNPRTAERAIPAGTVSIRTALVLVACCSALFVGAAAMISRLCLVLSVPVLAVLFFYSYTKRFTALSHLYLGLSISLAPVGAWIAVTGRFDPEAISLTLALLTYIAGFDILYACQDTGFDKAAGLFSIPARLGIRAAFHIAAALHAVSFVCFFSVLIVFDLGPFYLMATMVIGILLVLEHRLVRPHDLSRIQVAFFHVNSAISVILFVGITGDEVIRRLL